MAKKLNHKEHQVHEEEKVLILKFFLRTVVSFVFKKEHYGFSNNSWL